MYTLVRNPTITGGFSSKPMLGNSFTISHVLCRLLAPFALLLSGF